MCGNGFWKKYSITKPEKDGIYEVRIRHKNDLISPTSELLASFEDGEWNLKMGLLICDYEVIAWREI